MGSGFAKMKKQARAMQEQYEKLREETKKLEATGTSGNGLVSITLNGEKEMKKIQIKPECVVPTDVEALEDLIRAAYNDASKKIDAESPDKNFSMPGMPNMF
jgi:DNA-binding YbaB/EbfC family protein